MKNLILIFFIAISSFSFGQKFSVTPNGLRDEKSIDKSYLVIDAEGKNARLLYDNALKYITKTYKNPDYVIKGKIEGEYLKFVTHVSNFIIVNNSGAKILIDADYTIELSFKDGKVKFEVIELDMHAQGAVYKVLFTGGAFDGYPIYNKKGELKRPETKTDLETYFNSQVSLIEGSLIGTINEDKW